MWNVVCRCSSGVYTFASWIFKTPFPSNKYFGFSWEMFVEMILLLVHFRETTGLNLAQTPLLTPLFLLVRHSNCLCGTSDQATTPFCHIQSNSLVPNSSTIQRSAYFPHPRPMARQFLADQSVLIIMASLSHADTPHSVGLLWSSDQPDAESSTWQHTTFTRGQTSISPSGFEPTIPARERP